MKNLIGVFSRGFLLLCVVLTYGGGSSLLQGVAWVTMLPGQVVNSTSWEKGLSNTFNGEHACSLCDLAADLREQEKDQYTPDKPAKAERSIEGKEKVAFELPTPRSTSQRKSLLLITSEEKCIILLTSFEVDTPPPQLV